MEKYYEKSEKYISKRVFRLTKKEKVKLIDIRSPQEHNPGLSY